MNYNLKWWQWAAMAVLILLNAIRAFQSAGSVAALYGQLTGIVIASAAVVYILSISGRAVFNGYRRATAD